MEYYFIHMAAAAGLTVPYSIGPIFMHFFKRIESYVDNDITNVGF